MDARSKIKAWVSLYVDFQFFLKIVNKTNKIINKQMPFDLANFDLGHPVIQGLYVSKNLKRFSL